MAARAQHAAQRLSRFSEIVVICLLVSSLFAQNCLANTFYSRQELLDIGSRNSDNFIDGLQLFPEIVRTTETTNPAPPTGSAHRRRMRAALRAKLKLTPHRLSLPSIFLANVWSLANKMDELRLWITTHKWIMDCNIMILTETWLDNSVPDSAIELAGCYMFRADRTADDSGKTRGGGLCIYVNKAWCTDTAIIESHCSPDLEYLMVKCRPFYLPREFTSTIVTAAYIPPDANAKLAMKELHAAISKQQTNFNNMSPAPQEEPRLWTMFTPTWLMLTKQSPSPTLDSLTTSLCF